MKTRALFIFVVVIAITSGCSKSSDPAPGPTVNSSSATIAGAAFTATSNKTTDTGQGLEIKMSSSTQVITITTDAKAPGTYTFLNVTGARVKAGAFAYASYSNGTNTYVSESGTMTFTSDAEGAITGTYSLVVKDSNGNTVSITNGIMTGLKVTASVIPAGKCLIVSSDEVSAVAYDGSGKLLKLILDDGSYYLFIWTNGKVTSSIYNGSYGATKDDWFYTDGKLTKVVHSGNTANYTLNAAGQPTQVVYTNTSTGDPVATVTYTYDGNGNCTSADFGSGNVDTYSGYDTHPNTQSFLWTALAITFMPGDEGGDSFSLHNVGSTSDGLNYTYTYDDKGNVLTKSDGDNIYTFTYACN